MKLTGCIVALSRFISRSTDKCIPFFNALRGTGKSKFLRWTVDYEAAFTALIEYLG